MADTAGNKQGFIHDRNRKCNMILFNITIIFPHQTLPLMFSHQDNILTLKETLFNDVRIILSHQF